MATKNYMINDKWLDLDKQNIVELQSVDGELDSLKVNGSEVVTPSGKITITENGTDIDIAQYALADVNVEGGGGSSDFSTAEVTIINNRVGEGIVKFELPNLYEEDGDEWLTSSVISYNENTTTMTPVLYKGIANALFYSEPSASITVTATGNITIDNGTCTITGNGTITIS